MYDLSITLLLSFANYPQDGHIKKLAYELKLEDDLELEKAAEEGTNAVAQESSAPSGSGDNEVHYDHTQLSTALTKAVSDTLEASLPAALSGALGTSLPFAQTLCEFDLGSGRHCFTISLGEVETSILKKLQLLEQADRDQCLYPRTVWRVDTPLAGRVGVTYSIRSLRDMQRLSRDLQQGPQQREKVVYVRSIRGEAVVMSSRSLLRHHFKLTFAKEGT
jgi:hypothetical protein